MAYTAHQVVDGSLDAQIVVSAALGVVMGKEVCNSPRQVGKLALVYMVETAT